jgi:drug/metabolite transporter (DMT)-like permease
MSRQSNFEKTWFGVICALAATFIWSTNFVLARGVNELVPPVTLSCLRWFVAVVALAPFALKQFFRQWPLVRKHFGYLTLCGLLSVTLYNTLIYIAAHTTVTINLAVINESTPLFIIIFAWLVLGEKFTRLKILGVIMTTTGVLLLVSNGHPGNLLDLSFRLGDLWVLAAALVFGLYSILIKKRPAELSLVVFTFASFVFGSVILFPFFLWETLTTPAVNYDIKLIGVIAYLGIFASIVAYLAWTRAVQLIGPARSALIYYLLPVFSAILAIVFLDEPLRTLHIVSFLLIVGGVFVANQLDTKK